MRAARARRALAFLVLPAALVALAGPVRAATDLTFSVFAGECGATLYGPPATDVRVVHREHDGTRLGRADVTINGSGFASVPCAAIGTVRARDQLEAFVGGASGHLFVMPAFSLRADRAGDRFIGRGPANESVDLTVDACVPGRITCYGSLLTQVIATGGDGRFAVPTTGGYDLQGASWLSMDWTSSLGDAVHLRRSVPFLSVRAGRAAVGGEADARRGVSVTLRRAGAVVATGHARAARDGTFRVQLRHRGALVAVRVGDRVTADLTGDPATDAAFTVPPIAVELDPVADSFTFRCLPSGAYGARLRYPVDQLLQSWGNVDPDGSKTISHGYDVAPGWRASLWCGTGDGDWIQVTRRV